jgi:hypothetical protein
MRSLKYRQHRTVDADECDALSEGLRFLGVLSTGGPRRLTFYHIGIIGFLPGRTSKAPRPA